MGFLFALSRQKSLKWRDTYTAEVQAPGGCSKVVTPKRGDLSIVASFAEFELLNSPKLLTLQGFGVINRQFAAKMRRI
jgi:hypothetical protein